MDVVGSNYECDRMQRYWGTGRIKDKKKFCFEKSEKMNKSVRVGLVVAN